MFVILEHSVDKYIFVSKSKKLNGFRNQETTNSIYKKVRFWEKKIKIIYIEKNSRQENYNVLLQRLFKILTNDTYNIQAIENSYWVKHQFSRFFHVFFFFICKFYLTEDLESIPMRILCFDCNRYFLMNF